VASPETPTWDTYNPQFAPHVNGKYEQRTFHPNGLPRSQQWTAHCTKCNESHQGYCDSGQVRKHIQRFAMLHLHEDVLAAPRVVSPGSLRVGIPDRK